MVSGQKIRADQLLAEYGFFESRSRARQEILAGTVFADGRKVTKPAQALAPDTKIVLGPSKNPYVSRGGLKLSFALDHFGLSPKGCHALDVGASTGGFTEVLLTRGAQSVSAIDVGQGQLHANLRRDSRVKAFEKLDIRDVTPEHFDIAPNFAVCDVSFISLLHVLPSILRILKHEADLVALVKPQFEVGRSGIEKGGIVKDQSLIDQACARVEDWVASQPEWCLLGFVESPITGGDGNQEFFMAAQRASKNV